MIGDDPQNAFPAATARLPRFPVRIAPPDLGPWRDAASGLAGVVTRRAETAGPHLVLTALMHGNELAGAIVLDRMLRRGAVPWRGRLTFAFLNLDAFDQFDAGDPTASRFVDEDMNRIWDADQLDGPRVSSELIRARRLRRVIDTADILFDLHSMLWDGTPLILCGTTARGRGLACAIATPSLVVSDSGHAGGRRLIDYDRFSQQGAAATGTACLVEAGQHWTEATVEMTERSVTALLAHLGMGPKPASVRAGPVLCTEVTDTITASTGQFVFSAPYRGGDTIPRAGTVIATDGVQPIATPYDDCMLVMPNLRPTRGHTAVRLARYRADPIPAPNM